MILSQNQQPRRRFLGWSDIWRGDSTATRAFWVFWICVWKNDFTHSTWLD